MQMAVIEFARNTLKIAKAGSSELDKKCYPVIGLLSEWNKNGKMIKGTNKDTRVNPSYTARFIGDKVWLYVDIIGLS